MISYVVRRLFIMIPTVFLISVVSFLVIDLPPGDLATSFAARLLASQEIFQDEAADLITELRARYGLDDPFHVRYFKWASRFARGDWGFSFFWNKPVRLLIQDRIVLTASIAFLTLLLSNVIVWPAGVGAALRQYSLFDNIFSFTAFFMMAVPNSLFAVILMYLAYEWFDYQPGGLFSPDMVEEPWSLAKFLDFLAHVWMPLVVLGFEAVGSGLRTIRANVLDQLRMPFVTTARAKGVPETRLLIKYPIRMAANPWISTVGWILPGLVAGEVLVSIVIGLPTIGPLMLEGLRNQDMQLAGGILMLLATLTVIGTLISDLLLAVLDPRIRITE